MKPLVIERRVVEGQREISKFKRLVRYVGGNNRASVFERLYGVLIGFFNAPAPVFVFVGYLVIYGL